MKENCFVGIDTSNYTTSVAIADEDGRVIANLKRPLPVKEGERGLRQSDAVFAHVKNLPDIMKELAGLLEEKNVLAVGYSASPRDAEGSYMPCFLSGKAAAYSFAATLASVPVYSFSHQKGHVMAALYSAGAEHLISDRFGAFHVSGGTTEVLIATPHESAFLVENVGGTEDLNAGQLIDRTGVMMGISFPCGREMEFLALENSKKIPAPRISVKGLTCNLSGGENIAAKLFGETADKGLVSAAVFDFVGRTLIELSENLTESYGEIPIVYSGGVMSNSIIKDMLRVRKNTFFAEPAFSADNAAGTALLCRRKYLFEK